MKCPICESKTRVIDVRGNRRRRECLNCLSRFNTKETLLIDSLDPYVLKNSYIEEAKQ
mgnify:FL=1